MAPGTLPVPQVSLPPSRAGPAGADEALVLIAQDHFPIRPEIDEEADVV